LRLRFSNPNVNSSFSLKPFLKRLEIQQITGCK